MPSIRLVDLDENELIVIRPKEPKYGDPIACTEFDLGWPEHREALYDRAGADGSIDLTTLHGSRTITFDLRLLGGNGLSKEDVLELLHAVSVPSRRLWIYAQRDTWQQERRMLVRASQLSCVSTRASAQMFTAALSYLCPSGQMESAVENITIINPPASSSQGLSFPLDWPSTGIFFEPGASGSEGYVPNNGNTYAPVRLVITGRCDDPTIYNRTTGELLRFRGLSIASSESLVVDTDVGSAVKGPSSFYSKIDWTNSSWWGLAPGMNKIELEAYNMDDNCQLIVYSRDRWI